MTPEDIKFGFQVAWVLIAIAGICFLILTLPEFIRDCKFNLGITKRKETGKEKELWLDWGSEATLQDNGELCCPNCGSWTHLDDLSEFNYEQGTHYCPLCDPAHKDTVPYIGAI